MTSHDNYNLFDILSIWLSLDVVWHSYHSSNPLLGFTLSAKPRTFRYLNDSITSYNKNKQYFNHYLECVTWNYPSTLMNRHITSMTIAVHKGVFVPATLIWTYTATSNHGFYHFVEPNKLSRNIEVSIHYHQPGFYKKIQNKLDI